MLYSLLLASIRCIDEFYVFYVGASKRRSISLQCQLFFSSEARVSSTVRK
jgi:hypothetical protein